MVRYIDSELPTTDHWTPSSGEEREFSNESDEMTLHKEQLAQALALDECQQTRQDLNKNVQLVELKELNQDEAQGDLFYFPTPHASREVTFPRCDDDEDIMS